MTENIKKLIELASADEALKNRLIGASKEAVIAIAREAGITLTDADFELPEDALDSVSGGSGEDEKKILESNLHTGCICMGGPPISWPF